MQKFEFILKNEKKKFYDRFAILIFMLSGIGLTITLIYTDKETLQSGNIYWIASSFLLLFFLTYLVWQKKVNRFLNVFVMASFAIALSWVLLELWWVGFISLILLLLYVIAQRELKLEVEKEKIIYPSFPKKIIQWDNLSNLIIKDSLLTIDFKNNKIIQQYIDHKMSVNEQEFNDFCSEQLKK